MSFLSDLRSAQQVESKLAEVLSTNRSEGHCHRDMKIECKHDIMSEKTGNVAIEIKYKGEPSGWIKENDMLVYYVAGKFWSCSIDFLKSRLSNNKHKYKIVKGGDGRHSELALIKLYDFIWLFQPFHLQA